MSENKKIILAEDDEAAKLMTVTGWVSRNRRFYGDDERLARWDGSTHKLCDRCNQPYERNSYCSLCSSLRTREKYDSLPFVEWDGETPLCLYDSDEWFFDEDDIINYVEDNDLSYDDLLLEVCRPQTAWELELDEIYCDILAEDRTIDDTHGKLQELIKPYNDYIKENKPALSWVGSGKRTSYKPSDEKGE